VILSRRTLQETVRQTSKDSITFDGANWNDSFSEHTPAAIGQPASTQSAINRVVNGQAYDYFVAADGLAWYHDTGPDAASSMHIPDPRKLLNELAPGVGFVKVAATELDGVPVEQLRATTVTGLRPVSLPGQWNIGKLTALDVWADGQGVVRKLTMTASQTLYPGAMSLSQLRKLPEGHQGDRLEVCGAVPGQAGQGSIARDREGQRQAHHRRAAARLGSAEHPVDHDHRELPGHRPAPGDPRSGPCDPDLRARLTARAPGSTAQNRTQAS